MNSRDIRNHVESLDAGRQFIFHLSFLICQFPLIAEDDNEQGGEQQA